MPLGNLVRAACLSLLLTGVSTALAAPGDVYVANQHSNTVSRYFGPTGGFLGTFVSAGLGRLTAPTGLAFGPDGNLYVSSSGNSRVLRYDGTSGAFLGNFADVPQPFSLIFGPDGNMYVSSGSGDQ